MSYATLSTLSRWGNQKQWTVVVVHTYTKIHYYSIQWRKQKVCTCVCNQLLLCVTPTKTHHHNVNVRESVWNLLLLRLVARARMRIVCCPVIVSNISVSSLSLITKYIIFIYELFDSQLIVMKSKLLNLRDNRLNSNTRDHHQ